MDNEFLAEFGPYAAENKAENDRKRERIARYAAEGRLSNGAPGPKAG